MNGALKPARRRYGIESSSAKAAMARSDSPICAATRGEKLDHIRTIKASFSIGIAAMARSPTANAAALSPRPILVSARTPIRDKIFRLFFEKRFQFAARLSPTFLGAGMVASEFLRPA